MTVVCTKINLGWKGLTLSLSPREDDQTPIEHQRSVQQRRSGQKENKCPLSTGTDPLFSSSRSGRSLVTKGTELLGLRAGILTRYSVCAI